MAKKTARPPVKPVGRILYSQYLTGYWMRWDPKLKDGEVPVPTFDKVCDCKGFSTDRPFSVFLNKDATDTKPFKVVFHWRNDKPRTFVVKHMGEDRTIDDDDTRYMMDVLEEHATKDAAQKAMRRFATEAFAKVNDAPTKAGDVCHCTGFDDAKLRVGDLVEYASCPGIVWRITGERRANAAWYLQIAPAFSFLVRNGTNKAKELRGHDVYNCIHPIDIVAMASAYTTLGLTIQDEARRKAQ